MPKEAISGLLSQLHDALGDTEGTSTDLQAKVNQFEQSLQRLIEDQQPTTDSSLQDQINQLEAEFAAEHPVADRILREIMEVLNRIGV